MEILRYSWEALAQACASAHVELREDYCKDRRQVRQIDQLLKKSCKWMGIEHEYVDNSYLDDYAAYYAKCFPPYNRFCKRIHFFTEDLKKKTYEDYLGGDAKKRETVQSQMNRAYLGNMVVRPLPFTFVGRTTLSSRCLEESVVPIARSHTFHVAGATIKMEGLAFQEQDRAVAACATAALWSSLHQTGHLFHTRIPTPAEITDLGGNHQTTVRALPSTGLDLKQLAWAVRSMGLEVATYTGRSITDLKGLIHGYCRYGLSPVLAVLPVKSEDVENESKLHAITISGLKYGKKPRPRKSMNLASSSLSHILVHDDQRGPHVELKIQGNQVLRGMKRVNGTSMDVEIVAVLIPTYPKIRVPYEDVAKMLVVVDQSLRSVVPESHLEWDLRLSDVNQAKEDIGDNDLMDEATRSKILRLGLPRFLWVASGSIDGQRAVELMFDSTESPKSTFLKKAIYYDSELEATVKAQVGAKELREALHLDGSIDAALSEKLDPDFEHVS